MGDDLLLRIQVGVGVEASSVSPLRPKTKLSTQFQGSRGQLESSKRCPVKATKKIVQSKHLFGGVRGATSGPPGSSGHLRSFSAHQSRNCPRGPGADLNSSDHTSVASFSLIIQTNGMSEVNGQTVQIENLNPSCKSSLPIQTQLLIRLCSLCINIQWNFLTIKHTVHTIIRLKGDSASDALKRPINNAARLHLAATRTQLGSRLTLFMVGVNE